MSKDDAKYAPEPDSFPRKGSSGSGGDFAYSVEARYAYYEPKTFAGLTLDTRWRRLHFQPSPIGVPAHPRYCPWSGSMPDLMSYEAAQALRWWFMAQAASNFDHWCLETRLVKHKITYSYQEEAVAAGAVVDAAERRSNFDAQMPPPLPKQEAA